ncbi:M1 family metallopeptidase [Reichenbachiella sp. MALMAid0571]|uniref:M1 family metallopeptidase n=1 Tax=Reichenbachiella sp. MALMAid0571 TaxID=3143939 RepID=UPI0032DFE429
MEAQDEASTEYRASRTRYIDLIHTKLEVSFDWKKQHLHGVATLDFTPYFFPQSDVVLDAKGMNINSVSILNGSTESALRFDYSEDQLTIDLGKEYTREDTLSVKIDYLAKPNERKPGGSDAIKSDKGLYFINPLNEEKNKPQQIWTQGETESNSAWFPTIDSPNEKCTQEMYITVEDKFKTLSNGVLVESVKNNDNTRTDYWEMDLPHAPYLFMMAVGDFAAIEDEWQGVPLTYLVEKEYAPYAKDIFGNTPEMMTYFSELLGINFPWQKYAQVVVRDFVSGAMENTTASVFMEAVQSNRRELLDRRWDDIIAHELFHQWFGDLVTTESWSNLTLNEGFANYSEYLWNEYKYGQDEADYNFSVSKESYFDEANDSPKSLIRYYYDSREDMFDRHSYNKGGWVLHMLRNYVGDEAFFTALNLYLNQNAFQTVEINDLRLAFEMVTGEDLNWFFDQWFMLAGHPTLDIAHKYQNDTLYFDITQSQNEETHLFKLPVFVDVWMSGEKQRFPLIIEEETETYKFPMSEAPQLVLFDPENQLLAQINHDKSDKELTFQYEYAPGYEARKEAMMKVAGFKSGSLQHELVEKGLRDSFFDIRLIALGHIASKVVKQKKYEAQLVAMLDDENPYVRAEVLSILTSANPDKYSSRLYEALNDSSYYVVGSAIQFIADSKQKIADDLIEGFKKENNINVIISLVGYFSAQEEYPDYNWYADKMSIFSGNELFYFIQYFSEMLLKAPEEERKMAVDTFGKLASGHPNYIVRLSAYQGLMLLSDVKGVEQLLAQIKTTETDERLLEIYKDL